MPFNLLFALPGSFRGEMNDMLIVNIEKDGMKIIRNAPRAKRTHLKVFCQTQIAFGYFEKTSIFQCLMDKEIIPSSESDKSVDSSAFFG